ncbi:MAG: YncE family protein, partial [candidate division WOR-3 bacterium]
CLGGAGGRRGEGRSCERVCAPARDAGGLVLVEGSGDSAFAGPTLGAEPSAFCSNPISGKVYCADRLPGWLTVLEAGTGAVLANVAVARSLTNVCYSPLRNKVYCMTEYDSSITVVGGASDSVVASVHLDPESRLRSMLYNPAADKVYCHLSGVASHLAIIGCQQDSVLACLPVSGDEITLGCNPTDNKVYAMDRQTITVIDGAGDSVLRRIPSQGSSGFCYSQAFDKVYVTSYSGLVVIDGASDSVLDTIELWSGDLCADRTGTQIYCPISYGEGLAVINCAVDSIVDTIWCGGVNLMCCDRSDNLLLLVSGRENRFMVVDCATNQIVGSVLLGFEPTSLFWDSSGNRAYAANAYGSCIAILRPTNAVAERGGPGIASPGPMPPTLASGPLLIPGSNFGASRSRLSLLDASGRRKAELRPGTNDVSSLAPGVYFIVSDRRETLTKGHQSVHKVVLVR